MLLPESGSDGIVSSLIDDLGPAAASLLSSGSGDYIRFRAILNSTSVMTRVVDSFDLVSVYELEPSNTSTQDAIDLLRSHVEFNVDDEFQYLSIDVHDRSPERAAELSNFFVSELNQKNAELLSQNAGLYRTFLQSSVIETSNKLDSARSDLQTFQETNGIVDLPIQTEAFLTTMAEIRSSIFEVEIRHEALEKQFGPNNPATRSAGAAARAANQKFGNMLDGNDELLPVAQDSLPGLIKQFANLAKLAANK